MQLLYLRNLPSFLTYVISFVASIVHVQSIRYVSRYIYIYIYIYTDTLKLTSILRLASNS